MAEKKKTDLEKVVKKAESDKVADGKKMLKNAMSAESDLPPLEEHSVEPVIKPQNKGNKSKGANRNGGKKSKTKTGGKANAGAIEKSKKKATEGKEAPVPVPDRRKRGFFDWFTDGGKGEPES